MSLAQAGRRTIIARPATKGRTTGRASNTQNEASDSKGALHPSAGCTNTNNMGSQAGGGAGPGK